MYLTNATFENFVNLYLGSILHSNIDFCSTHSSHFLVLIKQEA